jgi:ABC-type sulfate transport system permease component
MHKELAKLMKLALRQGWRVELTRKCHIKFYVPNAGIIVASSTPSDPRSIKNLRSQLRAGGLVDV